MSTSDAPTTDRERELEQRIRELEGQVAVSTDPGHDPREDDRPWKVAQQNGGDEHTRSVAPLPYRGPGAVLHHFPHLTGGSGGPIDGPYVLALARLLAELGYVDNAVVKGELTYFDNTLAGDVARFKRDHDVREQVSAYHGHSQPAEDVAQRLVGPYTVQALFEAVAEKRGEDVSSLIAQTEYDIARAQRTQRG